MRSLLIILFLLCSIVSYSIDARKQFDQGLEAFNSGNYSIAEFLFKQILDDYEFGERARLYLAKSVFYKKKYKAAIFEFKSYLNVCRDTALCTETRFWLGESYYQVREYGKAIDNFKRYIIKAKKGRLVAFSYDRLGHIYYAESRYDEAIIEWNRAIKMSKNKKANAERIYRIGNALYKSKKYDDAIKRLSPLFTSLADKRIIARARIITGRIYQERNKHNEALLSLNAIPDNLLKEYPYSDAQYFKALSYLHKKDIVSAKSLLDFFILISKESKWYYNALYELGKILALNNDKTKAIEYLESVRKFAKEKYLRLKSLELLAELTIDEKPQKAVIYLEEALKINKKKFNRAIILLLSKAYVKNREYKKADQILNEYLKNSPYDNTKEEEVAFLRARIMLEKGDLVKAKKMFKVIEQKYPLSGYYNELKYYFGYVHYQNKKYKLAMNSIWNYLKRRGKKQNEFHANELLLYTYLELNYYQYATRQIRVILAKYDSKKNVLPIIFVYVDKLFKKGKIDKPHINYIFKRYPRSREAISLYRTLGHYFYKKKQYKKAEKYYSTFLDVYGKKDLNLEYYNRIQSLLKLKKYKKIIAVLKKTSLPPLDEMQWKEIPVILTTCHFNLGNYEKVYKILKNENRRIYKKDIILKYVKSSIEVGDVTGAKKEMKYLKKHKKLYAEALFTLGQVSLKKNNEDEAKYAFEKILKGGKNSIYYEKAVISLAKIDMNDQNYKKAIKKLNKVTDYKHKLEKTALLIVCFFKSNQEKRAINLTQRNFWQLVRSSYGEVVLQYVVNHYYKQKNLKQLYNYARYLKRFKGNDNLINHYYGQLYYTFGYYKKSYYYFYALSSGKNLYSVEAYYMLGKLNMFIYNKKNEAIKYFTKVLEDKSGNSIYTPMTRINLAILYYENKKYALSKQYLKKIIDGPYRGIYNIQAKNLLEYIEKEKRQ